MTRERRTRRRRSRKEEEPIEEQEVQEMEEEEVEEPEEVESEVVKETVAESRRRGRRKSKEEEPEAEEPADRPAEGYSLDELMDIMREGESLILKKTSDDTFLVSRVTPETVKLAQAKVYAGETAAGKPQRKKLSRKLQKQFLHPDYVAFKEDWGGKTFEEKCAIAEEEGIEWESTGNEGTDHMKLTQAVTAYREIPKWKKGFETSKARMAAIEAEDEE